MYLDYSESKNYDLIRYLARQVFSKPVLSVEKLPGTMAFNYEINHRYIFKLPNEYTNQEDWLRQSQCAPVLQRHLTFQIPHPELRTVYSPEKNPLLSSSYCKIDGICYSDDLEFAAKNQSFKRKFFEEVSDAAIQIHGVSLSEIPFELPTKIDYLEKCFFRNSQKDNYLPKKLFRKLLHNSFFGLGESGTRTSLLAHTDLHSGNVLFNDKNKLVAVLDFDMMIRGDRFLEFRPELYADPRDINLFQKIYEERSGIKVNSNDVGQLSIVQDALRWFFALYNIYRALPLQERDKKMKHVFMEKMAKKE